MFINKTSIAELLVCLSTKKQCGVRFSISLPSHSVQTARKHCLTLPFSFSLPLSLNPNHLPSSLPLKSSSLPPLHRPPLLSYAPSTAAVAAAAAAPLGVFPPGAFLRFRSCNRKRWLIGMTPFPVRRSAMVSTTTTSMIECWKKILNVLFPFELIFSPPGFFFFFQF